MDLFESAGYGRLDPYNFGVWVNIDQALEQPDYGDISPLFWSTFHFPISERHRSYLSEVGEGRTAFTLNCFTLYAHETRHFHDLLASPYGAMLIRQYTRAALFYLMQWHELLFHTKAVVVPISNWIKNQKLFESYRPELRQPSKNLVEFEKIVRTMREKLDSFNRGALKLDAPLDSMNAISVLEGLAIIAQESMVKREFGDAALRCFRRSVLQGPRRMIYYGALLFLQELLGAAAIPEIASYLLFASLCGDFQSPDPNNLRCPKDLLVELTLWLKNRGFNALKVRSFYEVIEAVDDYFEERHGADLIAMFTKAQRANAEVIEAFETMVRQFQEQACDPFERGRAVVDKFQNFVAAQQKLIDRLILDPLAYCSSDYVAKQSEFPDPVLFIESLKGVPVDESLESIYYVQNESRIHLSDFPAELRSKFSHWKDGIVRAAHVLSPLYPEGSADKGNVNHHLWQQVNDLLGGFRFLVEGPENTPEYLARDAVTGLGWMGTKVFAEKWELKPHKLDPTSPGMSYVANEKFLELQRLVIEDKEKERVGKFLRARPTESLKDGGELARIVSHASNDAVDFGAEATA
jgi:hypothetical protein